jgi:hypothetical protein
MRIIFGLVFVVIGALFYASQLLSSINFALAQRLGLQEKAEHADPLCFRLELGTARWDSLSLWMVPVAGILMLLDHSWWPYAGLIGGGVYVDAGGREAVKYLGLRAHGVRVGTVNELRLGFGVFALLIIIGVLMIAISLAELT